MQELTIHIGPTTSIDGGPFTNFDVDHQADGMIVGSDETAERVEYAADRIEEYLTDELTSGEPIWIRSDAADDAIVTITVPIPTGYVVDVPGDGYFDTSIDRETLHWHEIQQTVHDAGARLFPNAG